MPRTAKGRRLDSSSGYYMPGIKFIEQSELERAEAVSADWARVKQSNPDVDAALARQYPTPGQSPPDPTPATADDAKEASEPSGKLEKGSKAAKAHMARLRAMRGKAKTTDKDQPHDEDSDNE